MLEINLVLRKKTANLDDRERKEEKEREKEEDNEVFFNPRDNFDG